MSRNHVTTTLTSSELYFHNPTTYTVQYLLTQPPHNYHHYHLAQSRHNHATTTPLPCQPITPQPCLNHTTTMPTHHTTTMPQPHTNHTTTMPPTTPTHRALTSQPNKHMRDGGGGGGPRLVTQAAKSTCKHPGVI
ncbi:hypothetical protein Pmani_019621 [Petrolisthes manimaculis]|uniref:Uncharacterized protein n=1 Tax=Petrolisthes manimaculis TaxID=1843537 RepID=A0AAE1PJ84_9EUCA|nr:hypothetical protein Pmani_019621 [Petrolisthes manimaculis]